MSRGAWCPATLTQTNPAPAGFFCFGIASILDMSLL